MENEMAIDAFHSGATTVVAKLPVTCLTSRTNDHRRGRSIMEVVWALKGTWFVCALDRMWGQEFDICAQWVTTYQNSRFPLH